MSFANGLSLSRIPLGILCSYFLGRGEFRFAGTVFIFAILSDIFDGKIARWRGTQNNLGAFLDKFSDQIFEVTLVASLTIIFQFPYYYFLIVFLRVVFTCYYLIRLFMRKEGNTRPHVRMSSVISLIALFFYGFAVAVEPEAKPLADGLMDVALPYVLLPIGACLEVLNLLNLIPQLFSQRG